MLVQEYAAQGDLFNKITPEVGMDHGLAREYIKSVASALSYLHSMGFVHRDIKPENVVIDEHGTAKLCDFGMTEVAGKIATHGSGTTPYMAPEIFQAKGKLVAQKAHDVWSLGVLLYVLITGDFPWMKAVPTDNDFSAFYRNEFSKGPWRRLSLPLIKLFQRIFSPEAHRPTIDELIPMLDVPFTEDCRRRSSKSGQSASCDDVASMSAEIQSAVLNDCHSTQPSLDDAASHVTAWSGEGTTLTFETATDINQASSDLLVVRQTPKGDVVPLPATTVCRAQSDDVDVLLGLGNARPPYSAYRAARRRADNTVA